MRKVGVGAQEEKQDAVKTASTKLEPLAKGRGETNAMELTTGGTLPCCRSHITLSLPCRDQNGHN
jgi:hypothetical protein